MSYVKIALLISYICIPSISAALITPALPLIQQSYHVTHGALNWVVSIFLLGYVFGQLIYGPLAKRFGCLHALRSGLLLNLVGIIICILSNEFSSYAGLLVGRCVTALGAASGLSCTFMLMNKLLPAPQAKQALSFSIIGFSFAVGIAVTAGGVVSHYWHWQDCFWLLFVHGCMMLLLTWQFTEPRVAQLSPGVIHIVKSYIGSFKNTQLIVYSLMLGLASVITYGYSAMAPVYAHDVLHLSPSVYGYWNLLTITGALASGIFGSYLMKKYDAKKVIHLALLLLVLPLISLAVIVFAGKTSTIGFFMTAALLYLFSGLLFPAGSYLASNASQDKVSASSSMSFINMGAAMTGVVITGYLPLSGIGSFATVLFGFFIIMIFLLHSRWMKDGLAGGI